jgi:hypothetical protein
VTFFAIEDNLVWRGGDYFERGFAPLRNCSSIINLWMYLPDRGKYCVGAKPLFDVTLLFDAGAPLRRLFPIGGGRKPEQGDFEGARPPHSYTSLPSQIEFGFLPGSLLGRGAGG